jgi:hypothetical protein
MWFEGKRMQLEDLMVSEVSQDQKHRNKDNRLHKNKHDHIKTQM